MTMLLAGLVPVRAEPAAAQRLVLVHYMPWFTAPPQRPLWGWHWTMNTYDPGKLVDGEPEIASHFRPSIGPYDSSDPAVIELHLLLMKRSGADGVMVDWYGLQDYRDYATLHRNTQRLVEQVERLGLKFALCYEDQTIPVLVAGGRIAPTQRVAHAAAEIDWLAAHWFPLSSYVRVDGLPLLLSFGQTGLTGDEWAQCLAAVKTRVAYFSQHERRAAALGAFDWPLPKEGLKAVEAFAAKAHDGSQCIPVAFPRFVDIYAEARVQASCGRIEDDRGATFRTTLERAFAIPSRIIQIATWNDWGEGTMIEPSKEFGMRDLEVLQDARRRHIDASFTGAPADFLLAGRLFKLRQSAPDAARSLQLDAVAQLIADGRMDEARRTLDGLGATP